MTSTPVTLRSLTDLVEVVPTLLGFHPTDSLVVLAIEAGHLALTARADLGRGGPAPSAALAPVWRRFPRASLMVVAFTDDPGVAWAALDEVDRALPGGSSRTLLHADGERWYDAPGTAGTTYDALGSVHLARATFSGRPIRRSRGELAALLEPARTPAEVTASLERVAAREGTLGDLVAEALALVEGHDDAPGEADVDDATVLCLATHDDAFLDAVLLSTDEGNASARASLWLQVVRSSVPRCAGGALVALGLAAWLVGNGALLSVCLEALDGRPGPATWVAFLESVVADAVPPAEWRERSAAILAEASGVEGAAS